MSRGTSAPREGQTFAGGSLAARYASFVKLPHTLFALPFAGVGAVLASHRHPERVNATTLFWIVLAFTAARFAAMGFNRIVDREYDALNPRTRLRELPSGRLTLAQAGAAVAAASMVFVLAAWMLNPLCGALAPVALAWIFFYSYTKRFTRWAHLVLGLSLAIAPVGAYLAIAGAWPQPWYAPVVLALGVMFWVSGFDIIYALQDIEFDRRTGLHSVAARYGERKALALARAAHLAAVAAFLSLALFQLFPVHGFYLGGVAVMAGLLVYEHRVVRSGGGPLDLPRIDRAFFRANIAVSTSFFAFTLFDRIARGIAAGPGALP
jgi:4-hydroxybenzoate polyprenyltransferase